MSLSMIIRATAATVLVSLAALGVSASAHAATLSGATATSSSAIGVSGTNAVPITVSATVVTGGSADKFIVDLPTGWSFVNPDSNKTDGSCPAWFTTTLTSLTSCQSVATSFVVVERSLTPFAAGDVASVTFSANSINVGSSRDFMLTFAGTGGAPVDTGTAVLSGGVTNSTVSFNANGGTGAIADQVASAAAPLTANVFSRSGFTFAGWNTAADGTGTAYADGASYDFAASTTLYAQWTPVLALTGIDATGYVASVVVLLFLGAGLVGLQAVSRRKAVNS